MAITFYYGSGSPYSWRVHLGLEHKGVSYTAKLLSFSQGDLKAPEFVAINPRQRVPAIVDDGFALYESSAILEYLDERCANEPWLFPRELRERALVRRRICEADAYLGVPVEALVEELFHRSHPSERDRSRIEAARRALGVELERLEQGLARDFLQGTLSAADFTLYPYLALFERFELRQPGLRLGGGLGQRTRSWMSRIEALPYFDRTYPPHWRARR